MKQKSHLLVALICLMIGVSLLANVTGCAGLIPADDQENIRKAYAVAVTTYVDMAEVYADAYDAAPSNVQAKWKEQVTPRVLQASAALRIWRDALDSKDAQKAADKAITDLTILMVDIGILQIE